MAFVSSPLRPSAALRTRASISLLAISPIEYAPRTTLQAPPRVRMDAGPLHRHGVPRDSRFCPACAAPTKLHIPAGGDERERIVCSSEECGHIVYKNPVVTVNAVAMTADKKRVLLVKRSIPPFEEKWCLPGGFHEMGESVEEGTQRECREEANAEVHVMDLLGVYDILGAAQVQLVFLSVLLNELGIAPGEESSEVRLFEWAEVPYDDIAFTTHKWAVLAAVNHLYATARGMPMARLVPERRVKTISFKEK
jgi:ADP-ribose pyrophosphatase YjhB (NUDIX family)